MSGYDERVLPSDYPVFPGYRYIADGEMVTSDIQGTVGDLKAWLNAQEIRRCGLIRRALHPMVILHTFRIPEPKNTLRHITPPPCRLSPLLCFFAQRIPFCRHGRQLFAECGDLAPEFSNLREVHFATVDRR